jgi:hypothetical protein
MCLFCKLRRVFIPQSEWQARAAAHRARLSPFVEPHLARRSRGEKHPVWDFLWEYYSFRPAHLLRWSPGIGVVLETDSADGPPEFSQREWSRAEAGITLDTEKFPAHRVAALHEILEILEATQRRAASFACFGMHEWAMVYRAPDMRHAVPLRLAPTEIEATVETLGVRCSHYDAFRFFTEPARPLNVLQPRADNRARMEQPGCIHATMDLYKWAYKFWPWTASELVADAFELARAAREVDMRASPYDFAALGFAPIALETPEGRREYQNLQRKIAERAVPIRASLIEAYTCLIEAVSRCALSKFH